MPYLADLAGSADNLVTVSLNQTCERTMTSLNPLSKMDSRDVRDHNIALVLSELTDGGARSRTYLSAETGLTPGSLTSLINELHGGGVIEEVDSQTVENTEGGRRKALFALSDASFPVAIAELRGNSVRMVCQTLRGRTIVDKTYDIDFRGSDPERFADFVARRIDDLTHELQADGISGMPLFGVVIPAPVFNDYSSIPAAIDFGWGKIDLGAMITAQLRELRESQEPAVSSAARGAEPESGRRQPDTKVILLNDAISALWAEHHYIQRGGGTGSEHSANMLYLKADLGVGGAMVVDNKIYAGRSGMAGGLGHIQAEPHGRPCLCGQQGCLATIADPATMLHDAQMDEVARECGQHEALKELHRRALLGQEPAHAVYQRALEGVRLVLGNAIRMIAPDWVVLGGYLPYAAGELFPEETRRRFRNEIGLQGIVASHFQGDASVRGALLIVRQMILTNVGRLMRGGELSIII